MIASHPPKNYTHQKSMRVITLLCLFLLSGCAALPPIATPSGRPEVTIATKNSQAVKSRIIAVCAQCGYTMTAESPSMLVFNKQMSLNQAMIYTIALGNVHSSHPIEIVRFTITPVGSATRVYATINTSMQNGFGQTNDMDMSKGKAGRSLHNVLQIIKDEFEGKRKPV